MAVMLFHVEGSLDSLVSVPIVLTSKLLAVTRYVYDINDNWSRHVRHVV